MMTLGSSSSLSDSNSGSRRSSWIALMQNYEDALEYHDKLAASDMDEDGVTAKMARLDIDTADLLASRGDTNDPKLQTIVETTTLDAAAANVPRIIIDNSSAPAVESASHGQLKPPGPFYRWMRTIHRRARHRPTLSDDGTCSVRSQCEPDAYGRTTNWTRSHHRQSSSGSSFAFVSAVKSASASLASVSAIARSRRTTVRSQGFSTTERSSRASISGPRASEDSSFLENQSLADLASIERSLQRRKVLEELISTEEGYISDVRFLMNVCHWGWLVVLPCFFFTNGTL